MLEKFKYNDLEIIDKGEQQNQIKLCIRGLRKVFCNTQQNFAELCYYTFELKKLFDGYLYIPCRDKYSTNYDFKSIMQGFGIDETQASRLCSCYSKFCHKLDGEKPKLLVEFLLFSKSALFELLSVPTEQLVKDIKLTYLKPDMSIKLIRDYVKNYKALEKKNERLKEDKPKEEKQPDFNEEDIPEAYNPKQYYEFDYFENKNKAQLLNIVWDLQKEYNKLKKEYDKIKKGV